ncbi:MAG: XRE family transcriptional regulator [Prevotellaceae bacterium]|nr:XRE family transcriptional regulator [Prevotellaceae bacterium]
MSQFNSDRLAEARGYNKMTGEELASLVGIKKQAISQFENKKAEPDYGTVCKMSEVLKFPVSFFYEGTIPGLNGNTYFRAPFSSNKKDLNSQRIKTRYVAQIYGTLARYVDFCPYNVPEFKGTQNISSIAQRLRDYWGLGQEPVSDMIGLMERNGIIMSEFATDTKKIDAFYQYGEIKDSAYHCVVLGTEKPSFVRRQFSAAHELGHIVLHEKFNDLDEVSREDFRKREDEANEFAAAFLLPKTAFLNDLNLYPNKLTRYVELKRKWRVSISAMVMRAYNLEAINQNQYQYLMRQISKNGWRTEEPLDDCIPLTHPKALRQAVNLIILNNILSGQQLLNEFRSDGLSLSKLVVDEVLSLAPDTITLDDSQAQAKVIPFAKLK